MVLVQVDPGIVELIAVLERTANIQLVMAIVLSVLGILAMGGALIVLLEFRSLRRLLHGLMETVDAFKPRVVPLLDRANAVTADLASMTGDTRRKVDDLIFTLEQINRAVQRGSAATEERVQRFAAVIDVVQTEAEELLLDAAATARGVHETARLLREPLPPRGARARSGQTALTKLAEIEESENEEPR